MQEADFHTLIEAVLANLEEDCRQNPQNYRKSGEAFEPCVKRAVERALAARGLPDRVDYTPGGHGFPDFVLEGPEGNRFGIEVKSSSGPGKGWRINGNSVQGSTRVPGLLQTVIVFGKVRGAESEFRARDYAASVANVMVTHSPRYLIDLDVPEGESFFDQSHLSYAELNRSEHPIRAITDYFLRQGQQAWWLAESTPAAIQMMGSLSDSRRRALLGYGLAHFPEIFSNSRTKFYRYMSWLASEKSVVDASLRDRFTAGGRADVVLAEKTYPRLPRIFTNLHLYRQEVLRELTEAEAEGLEADWGVAPAAAGPERLAQWAQLVAGQVSGGAWDEEETAQLLQDIVGDP